MFFWEIACIWLVNNECYAYPQYGNFDSQEEDNEEATENEAELVKSLNKQRRRAVAAVRKGHKTTGGRNSYKDKGGRSSHNSKIQKQLSSW